MSEKVGIHIGQCGIQVGYEALRFLSKENSKSEILPQEYFRYNGIFLSQFSIFLEKSKSFVARSVLIDMEPKVIQQCDLEAKKSGLWNFDPTRQYHRQSGSANNWAFGCVCFLL